jgi:hypothetical protein
MNMRDVLRHLIDSSDAWSQNRLAAHLGLSSQAMANRMAPGRGVKADFAAEALDALGYDLVAVPKGSRLPAGSVRVGR